MACMRAALQVAVAAQPVLTIGADEAKQVHSGDAVTQRGADTDPTPFCLPPVRRLTLQ